MEIEFHITVEDWPDIMDRVRNWEELINRLRTACAYNLPHAFLATVYSYAQWLDRRTEDRRRL